MTLSDTGNGPMKKFPMGSGALRIDRAFFHGRRGLRIDRRDSVVREIPVEVPGVVPNGMGRRFRVLQASALRAGKISNPPAVDGPAPISCRLLKGGQTVLSGWLPAREKLGGQIGFFG